MVWSEVGWWSRVGCGWLDVIVVWLVGWLVGGMWCRGLGGWWSVRWWSRVGGVWAELVEWCVVDSEEPCLPGMELPFKSVRYADRVVSCRKVCGVHLAVGLYWSST